MSLDSQVHMTFTTESETDQPDFNNEPFQQGKGYADGAYDKSAILPAPRSWTGHSTFKGPDEVRQVTELSDSRNWADSKLAVAEDGTMYFSNSSGILYALSPDGTLEWNFKIGEGAEIRTAPVIAEDGRIFFGVSGQFAEGETKLCDETSCYKGGLFALNPDGTEAWKVLLDEVVTYSGPTISPGGSIYIGTESSFSGDQKGKLY
ncbi:PQQ-like beta-propeller repeat protein [Pontibacillus chungwhensis]|nr:PQQ-like beta-propeller repeat protein [Pontibacillus chungwhensis]